ncbi:MAG: DNA polymerase III subunit epsilon [Bacteroidetes bacterium 4572_112]|nr:MAG: DNA polymerase III subunit epsilon [Bacteroidetes bacterium 4572_112]
MKLNLGKALVFFDLETTGINAAKDRIVEIALLKVMPDGSEHKLEQRINPEIKIPRQTSNIHGIFDEDVKDMPTFKEYAPTVLKFIDNSDLAGYNSNRFDVPLLVEEFMRAGFDFDMKNRRLIDVQTIFMKMEQRTLSAANKFYLGTKLENAHSAMADVQATYDVFKAQLDKYKEIAYEDRKGNLSYPVVNDMKELAKFATFTRNVDLAGQIVYDDNEQVVFNFGKHKGKKVSDILKKEPNYFDWMMKADFPAYTKKVLTEIKLQNFNMGK